MIRNEQPVGQSKPESHRTVVFGADSDHSDGARFGQPASHAQAVTDAPSSSRALDKVLGQLKANIIVEQEAMDELLVRLRARAG